MRRHAALLRLGASEDDDPNDDLWALHEKYNQVQSSPQEKKAGAGFCRKAKQALWGGCRTLLNLQISGSTTAMVICLMFVIRFTLLESPALTFSKVLSQEHRDTMNKLLVSLKHYTGAAPAATSRRRGGPRGLTQPQRNAYVLASNLSERHGPMMMLSMWDGWRRMSLAQGGMSAAAFEPYTNAALLLWLELMESLEAKDLAEQDGRATVCPESLSSGHGNGLEAKDEGYGMEYNFPIPCGVTHESTVTVVGKPVNDFYIQLMKGVNLNLVVYKIEVKLHGDGAPYILQTQPAVDVDRFEEPYVERCPANDAKRPLLPDGKPMPIPPTKYVDSLHPCSDALGKPKVIKPNEKEVENEDVLVGHFPGLNVLDESGWFPFTKNHPFVLTITFGVEGFHVHVDGKYVCAFLYNQVGSLRIKFHALETISALRIGGDVVPVSVMAKGLAMPKQSIPIPDHLKVPSTALDDKRVEMLVGVASGSTEFERRMGVRRSWAQYPEIRFGRVLLRFFVGLTGTKKMNRRIFKEANLFKDVVILPYMDEPKFTVLKTVAMCDYMSKYTHAPYLMKTDDDTFVRVDEVLAAATTTEIARGLVYGSIEADNRSARNKSTPWYSSEEEWRWSTYPVFPRGPGYIISRDIADFVATSYADQSLELFRVENVAMGVWVDLYKRQYLHRVDFVHDPEFLHQGCDSGYGVAHGQNLQQMLCLWKRLQRGEGPMCCDELAATDKDLKETTKQEGAR